jgi:hypothetical protein
MRQAGEGAEMLNLGGVGRSCGSGSGGQRLAAVHPSRYRPGSRPHGRVGAGAADPRRQGRERVVEGADLIGETGLHRLLGVE